MKNIAKITLLAALLTTSTVSAYDYPDGWRVMSVMVMSSEKTEQTLERLPNVAREHISTTFDTDCIHDEPAIIITLDSEEEGITDQDRTNLYDELTMMNALGEIKLANIKDIQKEDYCYELEQGTFILWYY